MCPQLSPRLLKKPVKSKVSDVSVSQTYCYKPWVCTLDCNSRMSCKMGNEYVLSSLGIIFNHSLWMRDTDDDSFYYSQVLKCYREVKQCTCLIVRYGSGLMAPSETSVTFFSVAALNNDVTKLTSKTFLSQKIIISLFCTYLSSNSTALLSKRYVSTHWTHENSREMLGFRDRLWSLGHQLTNKLTQPLWGQVFVNAEATVT